MELHESKASVATLLIENNWLFREGLKRLLSGSQFDIQRETDSLEAAIDCIQTGFLPNLVILDFQDDDAAALDVILRLRKSAQSARLVVLTDSLSTNKLAKVFEAGVDAYLLSDMSPEALIHSLALTMLGEKVLPTNLAKRFFGGQIDFPSERGGRSSHAGILSTREIEILRCLAHGDPNKKIANQLNITEATVKVHLRGLLRKINVCNRTQAAIWAVGQGIDKRVS